MKQPSTHRRVKLYARVWSLARARGVRGFSHVLTGNLMVTFSQSIQFLILARLLGPGEFGKIAAAAAVAVVLLPFSGMGAASIMVMRASRDPQLLPVYFGNTLVVVLLTGIALTAISAYLISPFLGTKGSILIMLVFCLSELVFSKVIDACWQVFVSNEELHWTSIFLTAQSIAKLAAVLLFAVFSGSSASRWIWWALASNALIATSILLKTIDMVGRPRISLSLAKEEFLNGVPFAIGLSAKGFYTDADKIFLARYGAVDSLGVYTLAFRVVQIALVPIRAVSITAAAKYFRAGEAGLEGSARLAGRLGKYIVPLALVFGAAFFLASPLLSLAAGARYVASEEILRWLFALPVLLACQSLLNDALAGSGYQLAAAVSQVVAAGVACIVCVLLIPTMDWKGAVIASYVSQTFLTCALLGAVLFLSRKSGMSSKGRGRTNPAARD